MTGIFNEHTIIVTRFGTGSWTNGFFVDGSTATFEIKCNVQPVSYRELLNLPESQRTKSAVKVFSADELKEPNIVDKKNADRFTYNSKTYEVHKVRDWSQLNIPHYESIGVEIDIKEANRKP